MTQVLDKSSPALPRFFYFINGIRADIADLVRGWQYRAARWVEINTPYRADTYHYKVHALTRWLDQPKHVDNAGKLLMLRSKIEEQKIVVGHSNGCVIALDMLGKYPGLQVAEMHLIAAAAEDSFDKNGLNKYLKSGQIGKAYIYVSSTDTALRWARYTHWVNWLNPRWGYGDLGKVGPSDVAPEVESCFKVLRFDGYDHSTYFSEAPHSEMPAISYFDYIMRIVSQPE